MEKTVALRAHQRDGPVGGSQRPRTSRAGWVAGGAGAWRVRGRQVEVRHRIWCAAALVPTDGPAATEVLELNTPGALATPGVATPGMGVKLQLHHTPAWRLVCRRPFARRGTGPESATTCAATRSACATRANEKFVAQRGRPGTPPCAPSFSTNSAITRQDHSTAPRRQERWRVSPMGVWAKGADARP